MPANYIVVSAANAELTKIALGMLGAKYLTEELSSPTDYPMPGPTFFIWGGEPSANGTQWAFGPFETGIDANYGPWCLGRELEITDPDGLEVSVTLPSSAQSLERTWFATP